MFHEKLETYVANFVKLWNPLVLVVACSTDRGQSWSRSVVVDDVPVAAGVCLNMCRRYRCNQRHLCNQRRAKNVQSFRQVIHVEQGWNYGGTILPRIGVSPL